MKHHTSLSALCLASLMACNCAHAGLLDFFSSNDKTATAAQGRKLWKLEEFTSLRIVPSEGASSAATAPANRHPAQLSSDTLQTLLQSVQIPTSKGHAPLLTADEARKLAEPLSQALATVQSGEDIQLLSAARSGEADNLETPKAVTAKVFVTTEGLQLLVHDARFNFFDQWRGTGNTPNFNFGGRTATSTAQVQSPLGQNRQPHWLSFPLTAAQTPAALIPAKVPTVAPPAPGLQLATPPASKQPPAKRDAAFFDEQEERLKALKRLRDKDLISEPEFQQKRQEILQAM